MNQKTYRYEVVPRLDPNGKQMLSGRKALIDHEVYDGEVLVAKFISVPDQRGWMFCDASGTPIVITDPDRKKRNLIPETPVEFGHVMAGWSHHLPGAK